VRTPAGSEREIQPADPRVRRLAIRLGALAGAAFIAYLPELERELGEWLASDSERTAERARALLVAPGLAVVRDTPVRRGAAARLHGQALYAIALVLASAAILLPLLLLRLAVLLR